jgi:hypothetical protein
VYLLIVTLLIAICLVALARRIIFARAKDLDITWALIGLIFSLIFSLPQTNALAERFVGGLGVVNLVSHIVLVMVGWFMTRGLISATYPRHKLTELAISRKTPLVSILILAAAWGIGVLGLHDPRVVLDSAMSPVYWTATFVPFLFGIVGVFQTRKSVSGWDTTRPRTRRIKAAYNIAAVTYVCIVLACVLVWATALYEPLWVSREVLIYLSPLLLLVTLICFPVHPCSTQGKENEASKNAQQATNN